MVRDLSDLSFLNYKTAALAVSPGMRRRDIKPLACWAHGGSNQPNRDFSSSPTPSRNVANYHTHPSDFRIQISSPNFSSYKSWLGIVEFTARQRTGKALQTVPFRSHAQKILRPLVSCPDFQSPSDPETGCGTVRRRGKHAAGGTAPNKSWHC